MHILTYQHVCQEASGRAARTTNTRQAFASQYFSHSLTCRIFVSTLAHPVYSLGMPRAYFASPCATGESRAGEKALFLCAGSSLDCRRLRKGWEKGRQFRALACACRSELPVPQLGVTGFRPTLLSNALVTVPENPKQTHQDVGRPSHFGRESSP